jgi:dTDP-4-amino-4,6-dideoxygalactose transaminase
VALPGAVCPDVLLAVIAAECEPFFCDVDLTNGLVPESEWIRARSAGAEVAIVVHLYGNCSRVAPVRSIFPAPECLIVDDAAQALGSFSNNGQAGALGDVGLISFGPTKHIALGNAAVLFRDRQMFDQVAASLRGWSPAADDVRASAAVMFRSKLEHARAGLRSNAGSDTTAFTGLLDGLEPLLDAPATSGNEQAIQAALDGYQSVVQARIAKAALWSSCLAGCGLEPVGMGSGCVPWRYACRLPGLDWASQHKVSEAIRAASIHVSNWYLPANWFVGQRAGALPGVEILAREVFQFWIDESVSFDSITRDAAVVRREISNLMSTLPAERTS